MRTRFTIGGSMLVWLALAQLACGDKGAVTQTKDTTTAGGKTRVLLTDDPPFPYYALARVDLHIDRVSGSMSTDTGAGSTGWITLAEPNRTINVLALQHGLTEELNALALPTGTIHALRMVIDTMQSSITLRDGRVLTHGAGIKWQYSGGVLDAILHDHIGVPDSGGVAVMVFDVGEAFIPPGVVGDSNYYFTAIMRAADANLTGTVTGAVRAHAANGASVPDATVQLMLGLTGQPENTWIPLATAISDSTGGFRFSFITRSAYWAGTSRADEVYHVVVDAAPTSGLGHAVVDGVTVLPRQTTSVGTIVLP